jgi:hypothetical protein
LVDELEAIVREGLGLDDTGVHGLLGGVQ